MVFSALHWGFPCRAQPITWRLHLLQLHPGMCRTPLCMHTHKRMGQKCKAIKELKGMQQSAHLFCQARCSSRLDSTLCAGVASCQSIWLGTMWQLSPVKTDARLFSIRTESTQSLSLSPANIEPCFHKTNARAHPQLGLTEFAIGQILSSSNLASWLTQRAFSQNLGHVACKCAPWAWPHGH